MNCRVTTSTYCGPKIHPYGSSRTALLSRTRNCKHINKSHDNDQQLLSSLTLSASCPPVGFGGRYPDPPIGSGFMSDLLRGRMTSHLGYPCSWTTPCEAPSSMGRRVDRNSSFVHEGSGTNGAQDTHTATRASGSLIPTAHFGTTRCP